MLLYRSLSSCAPQDLSNYQQAHRLERMLTPLEWVSYLFSAGNLLAGASRRPLWNLLIFCLLPSVQSPVAVCRPATPARRPAVKSDVDSHTSRSQGRGKRKAHRVVLVLS